MRLYFDADAVTNSAKEEKREAIQAQVSQMMNKFPRYAHRLA
jgi:hypothetical protein